VNSTFKKTTDPVTLGRQETNIKYENNDVFEGGGSRGQGRNQEWMNEKHSALRIHFIKMPRPSSSASNQPENEMK